jgi:serine/threonine protein phosphatase PrpC
VSQSNAIAEDDTLVSPNFSLAPVAYGATDVGCVRQKNEDSFAVAAHLGLFMVADGMGGAAAGEIASGVAIEQVQRAVEDGETTWTADSPTSSPESSPRRFIAGIHRANRAIRALAHQDALKRGMGTTFAGLLLLERCAVVAHVGDSRVYRLRDETLERLTRDHSLANQLVERGYLKPEEVASFPRRNVITRAVGTHETVEVDTKIVDVRSGDAFLLCSDGLHGELDDDEIAAIVRASARPAAAVEQLIHCANQKGGPDNITVVLVCLDEVAIERWLG